MMKIRFTLITGDVLHRFVPLDTRLVDFTSDELVVSAEIVGVSYS